VQPYIEVPNVVDYCAYVRATYREANREPDTNYPVWPVRAQRDYDEGMSWAASCAKHTREMREALGLPPLPPPPGPPPRTGRVTVSGRAVADDAGPWNALGTTLFWSVREACTPHLDDNLAWARARGIEYVRGLCEATDWPPETRIDPREIGWTDKLRGARDAARAQGMRVYWTLFGGNQLTPQEQLKAVETHLVICHEAPELVQGIEISNENNGFHDSDGERRMRGFAEIYARHGYPTALTSWASGAASLYAGSAANIATEHFERDPREGGWRPVRQPWGYWDHQGCPPAFINNEPIGIGSSVAQDADPLRLACGAVVTYLCGGAAHVIHTGAGVYGVPMTHPVGGARPANLWEQPTLEPTLAAIAAMRALLPPGVATWARQNHHWPGHPFTFAPYQPGDESLAHHQGCVRAYAMVNGKDWVCLPFGVMGTFQMAPKQPGTWRAYEPLTGAQVGEGTGAVILNREALLVGRLD